MTFTNKTIDKFIKDDVIKSNNILDILNKCQNQSEKGFVYEKLWHLTILFGCCDIFSNKDYYHILGNINNGKPIKLKSLKKYVLENNVISGNANGCSDITLQNKITKEFIFMTSKFPKNEDDKKKIKKCYLLRCSKYCCSAR